MDNKTMYSSLFQYCPTDAITSDKSVGEYAYSLARYTGSILP